MSVFREYDIRGIADKDLPDPFVSALGSALAELALSNGDRAIYVGHDVRSSSDRLVKALCRGIHQLGVDTWVLPKGPTPLLYFSAHSSVAPHHSRSGVMITGSHNPPEYNGFKTIIGGKTLFGADIQTLAERVSYFLKHVPQSTAPGRTQFVDRREDYLNDLCSRLKTGTRKLRIVVDAGNGAGSELGPELLRRMGHDVIPLFCEFDGQFPNHHPDPTVPKNLQSLILEVKRSGADLGVAFDGDADRIGAVSAKGQIVYGDQLVLYYARDILQEKPGATIISEVKASQVVFDLLQAWGAKPVIWKTGHSLIKAKLKETGAELAGEMSGHMFFSNRFWGFDDAIYAAGRLAEGLSKRKETLDEFLDSLPKLFNTPELRVDCPDEKKFEVSREFSNQASTLFPGRVLSIDGARVRFPHGWGLLRASNTQPVLVMRFESTSESGLREIRDTFAQILKNIHPLLEVPGV
jgi:phosphomannomutase/phosphoglucomutase